jgi:threonine/homoserine/homoserine lactone efflux protein
MTESQIILFVVTSLIVIITPGQDLVLTMSRGISQGAKAGVATAAGVSVGLMGHTLFATFGLGALLLASDVVFSVIKYIGAAYLIYLGYKLFTSKPVNTRINPEASLPIRKCFTTGALSNLSNPKITVFYFAYLPQFISSGEENAMLLLLLGTTFALLTFIVKAPIGYLAGRFSKWLQSNQSMLKWFNRTSGTVLIGLGVKLAFEQR